MQAAHGLHFIALPIELCPQCGGVRPVDRLYLPGRSSDIYCDRCCPECRLRAAYKRAAVSEGIVAYLGECGMTREDHPLHSITGITLETASRIALADTMYPSDAQSSVKGVSVVSDQRSLDVVSTDTPSGF